MDPKQPPRFPTSIEPGSFGFAVVNDADYSASPSRALYIGVTGNVTVVMAGDGSTVQFLAVPAGSILPIRTTKVTAAGTSATNIVAIY